MINDMENMPMNTLAVLMIERLLMIVVNTKKTGARIKLIMKKRKITVTDIQKQCCLQTKTSVYRWLSGDNMPTIDNLVILADMFKCRLDDIIVVDRR